MGRIRQRLIKNSAIELVKRYPDRFCSEFSKNKEVVQSLIPDISKRMRNRIAGYITRKVNRGEITESK